MHLLISVDGVCNLGYQSKIEFNLSIQTQSHQLKFSQQNVSNAFSMKLKVFVSSHKRRKKMKKMNFMHFPWINSNPSPTPFEAALAFAYNKIWFHYILWTLYIFGWITVLSCARHNFSHQPYIMETAAVMMSLLWYFRYSSSYERQLASI